MCGIVAAAAENSVPVLAEGLKKLECSGYDSAELAVVGSAGIKRIRSVGRVAELKSAAAGIQSNAGIAPPISGSIAVVHNGTIENHESQRGELTLQRVTSSLPTLTPKASHKSLANTLEEDR